MAKLSETNQYLAAFTVNIITLGVGASIGWSSQTLPILIKTSNESPLKVPLTKNEASWVECNLAVGAIFGTFLFGYLSERIGRFWTAFMTALPQIFWWICVIVGKSFTILLIGRFFAGLSAGGVFVLVPLYISEISKDSLRGILGCFFMFAINLGTVLMFLAVEYLNYSIVPKIFISIPFIFTLTFMFLPETPQYLLKRGEIKKAENSLRFLRGCQNFNEVPEKVKKELLVISKEIEEETLVKNVSIIDKLRTLVARKSLIIGLVLVSVNQLSGCLVFMNYKADIFINVGLKFSPEFFAIIISIIQVIGSVVSTFVVGSMTRKLLYISTCFGAISGFLAWGFCLNLFDKRTIFPWLSISALSLAIFMASAGFLPLTFVLLSEILPQKIRSIGMTLCMALFWTLSFILHKIFINLVAFAQFYISLLIFCGFIFLGMMFIVVYVPETRNKSGDEIEEALR
ncbi:CLUMA_CG001113, isoform A [Clunio marinus]|uniref:CLUMA_CG001113, isoform A n=1 Tax=Clunio marinus TaxID=568069 RepID=A0A1J1HH17_9DIPT|nr:CLUMA_CG001113, isoform A [Clunio marinus]